MRRQKVRQFDDTIISRDTYQPIRTQYSHHVTQTNQSELSIYNTWHKPLNQPIRAQYSHHVTKTNQSKLKTHTTWHKPTNQNTVFTSRDINKPFKLHCLSDTYFRQYLASMTRNMTMYWSTISWYLVMKSGAVITTLLWLI